MSWRVRLDHSRINLHAKGRIDTRDADRQGRTAEEILARFARQPGIVLADEVGMGKTFVALAVAASVAWADKARRPVVVMVPPSLKQKWPRDFRTFRERCVLIDEDRDDRGLRAVLAQSGVDFFKYLDDPPSHRAHLIFLSHGSLHLGLSDPWTKLAILKHALRPARFRSHRSALPRFAARILRISSSYEDPDLYEELIATKAAGWREVISEWQTDNGFEEQERIDDDPVPQAIRKVFEKNRVDVSHLREALHDLPLRESRNIDSRLKAVRRALADSMREIWHSALIEARFRSPLIILDEAHHLKNPATRLASLFVEADAEKDARILQGALQGRFEKMLFLTATPFQLGHYELLNVLTRFKGIDWAHNAPSMSADAFDNAMQQLKMKLNDAQYATVHLDEQWRRLSTDDLQDESGQPMEPEDWWARLIANPEAASDRIKLVMRSYKLAEERMRGAESNLAPWIIRHLRPRTLTPGGVPRRRILTGAAILSDSEHSSGGLEIRDGSLLPFLLLARSQAILGRIRSGDRTSLARRATFAEGLASSYEAFLETRRSWVDGEETTSILDEDSLEEFAATKDQGVRRYLEHLRKALPDRFSFARHPKVTPAVEKTLDLWEKGEKVLIFCHFRATGRALMQHLSTALDARVAGMASQQLDTDGEQAWGQLERIGDRFDKPGPARRRLQETVEGLLGSAPTLSPEDRSRIHDVIRRFVRSPYYLVRHWPLEQEDTEAGFDQALAKKDLSGLTLNEKLKSFIGFISSRCDEDERAEYLEALDRIQTGRRRGGASDQTEGEITAELLPNVRLANGEVKEEQRRRLLLAFNTPFFPEILVASHVLAEGVDLHLDCRHVIHHDLCWNPSTLEQRTGRIDRIGAKTERVAKPIHVYLPYIAGTQDEKMYRVVRDRERWFQVIMGEKYALDEAATDRIAERVIFPLAAATQLAFRLAVWTPSEPERSQPSRKTMPSASHSPPRVVP